MNLKLFQTPSFWVVLLWFFSQVIWYVCFGVHFGLESGKYIEEAQYVLQNHQLSQFRYIFYFTTIAVIAVSDLLQVGLYGALIFIMIINLFSYLYFFKALKRLFAHQVPALIVVALLLSFWPYQSWSLYLYTECLFYSLVLILFSHLVLFERLDARFLLKTILILFLLVISRPLGILFILPTLLFIFFKLSKKQRVYFFLGALFFLLLLNFVVQVVFTTTPDWNMTRALTEDSIICDMPRGNSASQLDLIQHPNQFYQLFYYVTHNFSHFAGLALIRLKYFFTLVRDYYSTFHNLYLVGYLVLFYGSILFGLRRILKRLSTSLAMFVFSSILLFAATIALQCDDYHNRFFLTLTPFFAIMTVLSVEPIFKKLSFFSRLRKD